MAWLPHDLGTWGFILSVVAILLAIPLGIVATLLAPKVRLWWFLRNVEGTANKLVSLTEYRQEMEREPQFSIAETYIYESQFRMILACHLLAYVLVLAVAVLPKSHHAMTFKEAALYFISALPFVLLIWLSATYFCGKSLERLRRSTPMGRERVDRRIGALVQELRSKMPPQTD